MRLYVVENLLRLREAAAFAASSRDLRLLASSIKNFSDVYKRATDEEQGEYHYQYVTSLGQDHSANLTKNSECRNIGT